jgi:hypothetical protein
MHVRMHWFVNSTPLPRGGQRLVSDVHTGIPARISQFQVLIDEKLSSNTRPCHLLSSHAWSSANDLSPSDLFFRLQTLLGAVDVEDMPAWKAA